MLLDKWLSFFIYFAEKRSFFCVTATLFCVCVLLKTCKMTIFKNILTKLKTKTNSQNRRNLSSIMEDSINFQTKPTGSENSVSVGSWHVALRKCRIPFLKE